MRECGPVQQLNLVRIENGPIVLAHEVLLDPHAAHRQIAFIHIGRTGYDAARSPCREALRFGHALIATGGAANKISSFLGTLW